MGRGRLLYTQGIFCRKGEIMEQWAVFRDRETGRELCAYTIRGTFPGERAATVELLAAENGIPQEQIVMTIETIGGRQNDRV